MKGKQGFQKGDLNPSKINGTWNKGKKHSPETIKKIKASSPHISGKDHPMYGKKHSEKSKKQMSNKRQGKGNPNYGKTHSPETRKKISKSNKGQIPWSKGKKGVYSKKVLKKMSESHKKENLSAETRKKMSEAQKAFWKIPGMKETARKRRRKQIFPLKDSSIEIKIQNLLKKLKIPFFTHQYMKIKHGYQCDILIPTKNLVIECDGDYWHNYPIGNNLDHVRTKELLQKGFKVLRLWESEIKPMTIKQFKEKLNEK